jgi:D-threo-aldose 1-dehydrogenase
MPSSDANRPTISRLGFGTMGIGGQYADVTAEEATATIHRALDRGITFFDAAPQYGCGLAEERLGNALAATKEPAQVSTKVGKRIAPEGSGGECQRSRLFPGGHPGELVFDYSRDGTYRIVEDSLQRLKRTHLDHVLIHDVTRHFHGETGVHERATEAINGAVNALRDLQSQGVVGKIGIGLKDVDIAERFVREAGIDTVLVPGRLTLLDQSAIASGLLETCRAAGAIYIAAAPFDSGILAKGAQSNATYGYRPATEDVRARVAAIEAVCAKHSVPLPALALQYPLQFSGVHYVLAGMRSVDEVDANAAAISTPINNSVWHDLEALGLTPPSA